MYIDGSKPDAGVGAGIAIYTPNEQVYKTCYRLNNRCSNNQAEQIVILKALEELHHLDNITNKSAALHTESRISLDLLCNNPKHNALTENIKQELRKIEIKGWKVHFEWVKAHVRNEGN